MRLCQLIFGMFASGLTSAIAPLAQAQDPSPHTVLVIRMVVVNNVHQIVHVDEVQSPGLRERAVIDKPPGLPLSIRFWTADLTSVPPGQGNDVTIEDPRLLRGPLPTQGREDRGHVVLTPVQTDYVIRLPYRVRHRFLLIASPATPGDPPPAQATQAFDLALWVPDVQTP